jgi:hypothetical protein
MPFVEEVHGMIASKLIEAIRTSPVTAGPPRALPTDASGGRHGLFQKLRRK